MHYAIPSLALLATIAAAAPTDNPPWKDAGVLDPWGQYGNTQTKRDLAHLTEEQIVNGTGIISRTPLHPDILKELAKRTTIGEFKNYIPGCKDDPSDKSNPKPVWEVNHGVRILREGNNDQCTDGHNGDHCWTAYFIVEAAIEYTSWQPAGGAVNCAGTDTCASVETNIKQSYSTIGSTMTNGFDFKILDASVKFKLPLIGETDISTGITYKHEKTDVNLKQACTSSSSSQTCTWKPDITLGVDNCHQVWYADRVLHVWGQAQRTCNKCAGDSMQQNTGDGHVCVRGQKEFNLVLPINKLVHCNGKCQDTDPGLNVPPNTARAPYAEPADWASVHLRSGEDA